MDADSWKPRPRPVDELPLFAPPTEEIVKPAALPVLDLPRHRSTDRATSRDAARQHADRLTKKQEIVLAHLRSHQPITAVKLEELPAFAEWGPSTVRKRVSELLTLGRLEEDGVQQVRTKRGTLSRAMAYRVKDASETARQGTAA